jgi:hypothetical protein
MVKRMLKHVEKHVAVDNSWITVVNAKQSVTNPKALETSAALRMKRLILGHYLRRLIIRPSQGVRHVW